MVAPLPTPDPAHCMVLPVWLLKTNTLIPLTIIDKLLFDPALGGIVPNALHTPAGAVPPLGWGMKVLFAQKEILPVAWLAKNTPYWVDCAMTIGVVGELWKTASTGEIGALLAANATNTRVQTANKSERLMRKFPFLFKKSDQFYSMCSDGLLSSPI